MKLCRLELVVNVLEEICAPLRNGAPRASPWFPKTVPTYAPGRWSASVRKRQGSRLPKNLFGEQVGGSPADQQNPPKHDRIIAYEDSIGVTHSSTAKAVVSCVGG